MRTCLGCRSRRPKRELVRLVRRADGTVAVDAAARGQGRGAYVCADAGCVERALKAGKLSHAFREACRAAEALQWSVLAAGRPVAVAGHDAGA